MQLSFESSHSVENWSVSFCVMYRWVESSQDFDTVICSTFLRIPERVRLLEPCTATTSSWSRKSQTLGWNSASLIRATFHDGCRGSRGRALGRRSRSELALNHVDGEDCSRSLRRPARRLDRMPRTQVRQQVREPMTERTPPSRIASGPLGSSRCGRGGES